jgi:pimeloyl-ACP methyl ester carboxylesterase
VSFNNDRGLVQLAGTFSVPNGQGPFPAVLLIAASGPEGRDENAGGHLVFVVLADHLLRQGVAVLRYDKRGVGASTGDFDKATFDDLVSDAAAAFGYLKSRSEVDPHRAGVIGHSEGGSIGPAVAVTDKDVAFVVAMAGSGLSGEFRITEHWAYVAEEGGASPEQQANVRAMGRQIFRVVAATSDDAVASGRIAASIDAAVADKALSKREAADIRQLMTPLFVRMELNDNPLSYLKKVSVPVLALVGSLDRTVPAGPYVEVMRPVLETIPGSRLEVLPGLNHVMQTAQIGSPRESGSSKESISPLALRAIGDWIAEQVQRPHKR